MKCLNCRDWDCCLGCSSLYESKHDYYHTFAKLLYTVYGSIPHISQLPNFYSPKSFEYINKWNDNTLCCLLSISRLLIFSKMTTSKFLRKYILQLTFNVDQLFISKRQFELVFNYANDKSTLKLKHEKQNFLDLVSYIHIDKVIPYYNPSLDISSDYYSSSELDEEIEESEVEE
eukprot:TRINITY_DN13419_c0_g1_i1.p1 TRINITY_DN13419_c0_g1~~TRINITY_DN13419_c0_g1_i1.p1  ORF type:complete len:174 (-),score=24.34 TRINITY_DN13419_c0_g1_i1:9-530(-)